MKPEQLLRFVLYINYYIWVIGEFPMKYYVNLLLLVLLCGFLFSFKATASNSLQEPSELLVKLRTNKVIEEDLKGGQSKTYVLDAKANQYIKIIVEQKGIDVVLVLFSPTGEKIREMDSPNGTRGSEILSIITKIPGSYKLEIKSEDTNALPGRFEAKIQEIKTASEREELLVKDEISVTKMISLYLEGKYSEAIILGKESFENRKKLLGAEHIEVANIAQQLGIIEDYNGNYDEAIFYYETALNIKQRLLDSNSYDIMYILNGLGLVYKETGDYDKAIDLYEKALAIAKKILGPENRDTLVIEGNLSNIYTDKGDYDKAQILGEEVLTLRQKNLKQNHRDIAEALNNLALIYIEKGDYDKAESLEEKAIEISEQVIGVKHVETAIAISNLGTIYSNKKEYEKAKIQFEKALSLFQEILGNEHPYTINCLHQICNIYLHLKEYDKAENLNKKILEIIEKLPNINNKSKANYIATLGLIYLLKKNYDESELLLRKSLEIRKQALGNQHLHTAISFELLSKLYLFKENLEKAIDYRIEANKMMETILERNLLIGSQNQKLSFLNFMQKNQDDSLSLHLKAALNNQQAAKMALNVLLTRKGRSLDVMTNSIAILRTHNSKDQVLIDKFLESQRKLAALVLKGADKDQERYLIKVKDQEEEIEKIEKQISEKSAEFKNLTQKITLESIQKCIPKNSVLLEFGIYRPYDIKTNTYNDTHYVGYFVKNEGAVSGFDLGKTELIDEAIIEFRDALIKKPGKALSNVEKDIKPKARILYDLIMKPICKLFGNPQHLLIAPDGLLSIVPFEVFVDEEGKYLIKKYEISYLSSGRDLIRVQTNIKNNQLPVIIADPDYGEGEGPILAGNQYTPLKPLIGGNEEANELKKILPNANLYLKNDATKERVLSLNSPELLHIITHGLFLPDINIKPSHSIEDETNQRGAISLVNGDHLKLENPLLRSYLFFADANTKQSLKGSEISEDKGILTSLELSSVNLTGTKLVVLSACDTGLGDVKNGQGVYGLRRALVLAGSQTQMISLWTIDDQFTTSLMINYYKLLKSGETRSQALRKVQLSCLDGTITNNINGNMDHKNISHPYYWASFIQSGEWGDLDGKR